MLAVWFRGIEHFQMFDLVVQLTARHPRPLPTGARGAALRTPSLKSHLSYGTGHLPPPGWGRVGVGGRAAINQTHIAPIPRGRP